MHTLYSLSDSRVTAIQITPAVTKQPHGVQLINIYPLVTGADSSRLAPVKFTAIDDYIKDTAARSVIGSYTHWTSQWPEADHKYGYSG